LQLKFSNTESILVYLFQTINNFIMSKAVQYAVGLAGLALTIYVVGVAWKSSQKA